MADYPKVYLTKLLTGTDTNDRIGNGLCMKKCPAAKDLDNDSFWTANCKPAVTTDAVPVVKVKCEKTSLTAPLYASTALLKGPYCVPDSDEA